MAAAASRGAARWGGTAPGLLLGKPPAERAPAGPPGEFRHLLSAGGSRSRSTAWKDDAAQRELRQSCSSCPSFTTVKPPSEGETLILCSKHSVKGAGKIEHDMQLAGSFLRSSSSAPSPPWLPARKQPSLPSVPLPSIVIGASRCRARIQGPCPMWHLLGPRQTLANRPTGPRSWGTEEGETISQYKTHKIPQEGRSGWASTAGVPLGSASLTPLRIVLLLALGRWRPLPPATAPALNKGADTRARSEHGLRWL